MDEELSVEDFKFELLKPTVSLIKAAKFPVDHALVLWTQENPKKKCKLLEILTEVIVDPAFCDLVAKSFTSILPELVSRAIKKISDVKFKENDKNLKSINSWSILLLKYPYLNESCTRFILQCKEALSNDSNDNIVIRMETFHNLLKFDFNTFFEIVNWDLVIKVACDTVDANAKFNAICCLLLAAGISDFSTVIPDQLFQQLKESIKETCREKEHSELKIISQQSMVSTDGEEIYFTSSDIQCNFTTINQMMIQTNSNYSRRFVANNGFVFTKTSFMALQGIVLSMTTGTPVLLEGELGTGKTVLLEYLASIVGRSSSPNVLKLQLGDQTDSKSIIGMHVCTESPGEFKWQPGTLTQAVENGSWLILEDIDSAPLDVISVLIPLMESKSLVVPGMSKIIKAAPGFQLFLTRRVQKGHFHQNAPSSAIEHLCSVIQLELMTKEELEHIASKKHEHLKTIIPKLVDVYAMISSDLNLNSTQDTSLSNLPIDKRQCTSRDFFKWCQRIAERTLNSPLISINSDVFEEAYSCFCVPVAGCENRQLMSQAIGSKFGISKEKVNFYISRYKPQVQLAKLMFIVGRVSLPRIQQFDMNMINISTSSNYAFTRHSLNLLEQISVCVTHNEPVLLVGETGCGKTATIQYLAMQCGHKFSAINMSQQSDVTDLLGGFKPVDSKQIFQPVRDKFESLFIKTFSEKQNVKFLGHIQQCWAQKKWDILFKLMLHCKKAALQRKGLKKELKDMKKIIKLWKEFGIELKKVQSQLNNDNALAFKFMEGGLIKAIRDGDWILLDEINLATAETLECLSGLLESKSGSIVLVERGDAEPIRRHDNFRLFACMNPATDIGKKDLPFGIRNRFSEIYVDELNDVADLKVLVAHYLEDCDVTSPLVDGIVKFYQLVQHEAKDKLKDGTGHRPHYSLRTLCRALEYAVNNSNMMLPRAIYEGFCLSFLTQLDRSSHPSVEKMIRANIFKQVPNFSSILSQPIPVPSKGGQFCNVEGYWIAKGDRTIQSQEEYVLTSSVRENLRDLARVVSGRKYPVLLQGETSVGKTSLINYLAKKTGNQCVRINNHEHTDIQEYIGCYSTDANGKLVFKDGLLVDAMRKGYWIILDELNLAPTDVLEALNRLLDDNRELFIAETQETVKAHAKFVLFATQNPPGQYGGRKILSRAFRNRFVELHFDEIPSKELEIILHKRCDLPKSYCKKFVKVMHELQTRRKLSGIFAGKHGFITLRDLFRWAERYKKAPENTSKSTFYDWDQHIAEDGYMLLAGRCRKAEEADLIQETIEKIMKRKIYLDQLYGSGSITTKALLDELDSIENDKFQHLVWTSNLRRMAVLVGRAMQFNEPILLVGDTGCGKTTICQLFSHLRKTKLHAVNCHMHTESSDFIGGLRPVRHRESEDEMKLFEWCNGPLVDAMKDGSSILIDEISLADDSVLERLNSVLETEKILVLAEKGGSSDDEDIEIITAHDNFRLLATMNPGGDFGKKELSPALRNRFSEIWCPQSENHEDFVKIINHNIHTKGADDFGEMMMEFIEWFKNTEAGERVIVSIRDLLSWVDFINTVCQNPGRATEIRNELQPKQAFIHGAFLVFIDSLGTGNSWFGPSFSLEKAREACLSFLKLQTKLSNDFSTSDKIWNDSRYFGISPFFIQRGQSSSQSSAAYSLDAKTTSENALRLLRALQLSRPILLEGSPGVGKTSLVTAVARVSGNDIVRINLSEQTDVTDLFGADLPVEGGKGGEFAWRDGPFLKALKAGNWVVLDELNLASQSVLEGLNACFDHRAEIFVPELGKTFTVEHEKTKIFACQNPFNQGGGRKGLPKSFLNRFTKVYIDSLKEEDLQFIIIALHPEFDGDILTKMIQFNTKLQQHIMVAGEWGRRGSPWEFNIRDILRWCQLIIKHQDVKHCDPSEFLNLIYEDRMRTMDDKQKIVNLYGCIFGDEETQIKTATRRTNFNIGTNYIKIGHSVLQRNSKKPDNLNTARNELQLLRKQIPFIESVMKCIEMNWMAILVGPKACGKTSIVESIAYITCNTINTLTMNSNMDTTELLGGFEQVNLSRHLINVIRKTGDQVDMLLRHCIKFSTFTKNMEDLRTLLNIKTKLKSLEENVHNKAEKENTKAGEMFDEFESLLLVLDAVEVNADCLGEVKKSFIELKESFVKEGNSLHAKGQFEWVDGVLVESLKEGKWLLIENVNLCSSSVLDRLNGLLEPNGVLSIDERGVLNGEIPTVKPHPNFRLFLAMDPKYGEISRAMRNRGIEIYIPGEEEGISYSYEDKLQLLSSAGLQDNDLRKALLKAYKEITENGSKILITDLVMASKMVNELLNHGFEKAEALKRACNLSFVRNESQKESRENIKELIETSINSMFGMEEITDITEQNEIKEPEQNYILASIYQYNNHSLFSRIQRDILYLNHTMVEISNENKCLFGFKCFLERSTLNDLKYRLDLIKEMHHDLTNGRKKEMVNEICSQLNVFFGSGFFAKFVKLLENLDDFTQGAKVVFDIPFDVNLSGKILQKFLPKDGTNFNWITDFETLTSSSHRLDLILDRLLELSKQNVLLQEKDGKATNSFLTISRKCNTGSVSQSSLPHPVVELFHPFFSIFDAVIKYLLEDTEKVFTEDVFAKLLFALKWRDRFWKFCTKTISDSLMKMNFQTSLYCLHWNWLTSALIPLIENQIQHSSEKSIIELTNIIEAMSSNLNDGFTSIWNEYECKLLFEQPSLFRDKELYAIWAALMDLKDSVSIFKQFQQQSLEDGLGLLPLEYVKERGLKLMQCFEHIYEFSSRDNVSPDEILNLKSRSVELIKLCSEDKIADSGIEKHSETFNMELFPVFASVEVLAWHSCLSVVEQTSRTSKDIEKAVTTLEKSFEKLNSFPQLQYYGDFWLMAALKVTFEKLLHGKIERFPSHIISWLRSHCNEISRFKMYQLLDEMLLNNSKLSTHHSFDQGEVFERSSKLNAFSSSLANVMHNILNKRIFMKTKNNHELFDCFEWRMSVKEIDKTVEIVDALVKYYWKHGGLIQQLPQNICSVTLQDAVIVFCDVISILTSKEASTDISTNLECSDEEMLKDLLLRINSVICSKKKIPDEIQYILRDVSSFLVDWLNTWRDKCNDTSKSFMMKVKSTGIVSASVGLICFLLNLPRSPFDLVEEAQIKAKYFEEELKEIDEELEFRYDVEYHLSGSSKIILKSDKDVIIEHCTSNPRRVYILLQRRSYLLTEIKRLRKQIALRPEPSKYDDLLKDLSHFNNNICNSGLVVKILNDINNLFKERREENENASMKVLKHKIEAWMISTEHFMNNLDKNYTLYQDISAPIKYSLNQILNGFHFMLSALDWHMKQMEFSYSVMPNNSQLLSPSTITGYLASFPLNSSDKLMYPRDMTSKLLSKDFIKSITAIISYDPKLTDGLRPRLLHLALTCLVNEKILSKRKEKQTEIIAREILDEFCAIWMQFSQEKLNKEAEEDSFYKFKSKSHCMETDDVEINEKQYKELFPSFNKDYNDLVPKENLEDYSDSNVISPDIEMEIEQSNEMQHVKLFAIYDAVQELYNDQTEISKEKIINCFITSHREAILLSSLDVVRRDPFLDAHLASSTLLLTFLLKKDLSDSTSLESSAKPFDIYHDSNIFEVQKLIGLLGKFSSKLDELLVEFPEHPVLIQIKQIMERILSFPVNQPLMKFLTGLEILLKQAQEWETYASSKVSLSTHVISVTQQIIDWRKLELRCWPHLLQVVETRFVNQAKDWFLKIYSALNDLMQNKDDKVSRQKETAKLVQQFIENCSVGEYKTRLDVIFILYKMMEDHYPDLATVLWNIYHFYKQFSVNVMDNIRKLKTPIEKDLKDFVKIARWKDINFWAVKQATEKSHRTLHKLVKKYQEALSSPVADYLKLTNTDSSESNLFNNEDKLNKNVLNDINHFQPSKDILVSLSHLKSEDEWLTSSATLSQKLFKKCAKFMKRAKHMSMIESLDDFTSDVIANVKDLQSTDILKLPEEKRAQARKHLHARKRKALSTLFKTLSTIGLSYRKGLSLMHQDEEDLNVMSPVIELNYSSNARNELFLLTNDCHDYYFKCLARNSAFNNSMRNPSKELTPQDVARSKGLSQHLTRVVQEQRILLNSLIENHKNISFKVDELKNIVNSKRADDRTTSLLPKQEITAERMKMIKGLLDLTIYVMMQFRQIMRCCPEIRILDTASPLVEDSFPPINNCCLDDELANRMIRNIEIILEQTSKSKEQIDRLIPSSDSYSLATWSHVKYINDTLNLLERNCIILQEIEESFTCNSVKPLHSTAKSITLLKSQTQDVLIDLKSSIFNQPISTSDSTNLSDFKDSAKRLFKSVLVCVQELSKLEAENSEMIIEAETLMNNHEENEFDESELEDGHLTPKLGKEFFKEIEILGPKSTTVKLKVFVEEARKLFDVFCNEGNEIVLIYTGLVQYLGVVEYFLEKLLFLHRTSCKLLFVITGIFTDLATQGFCLPPDEVEATGEGATEFEDIQGGGIGEGEGMKDVSNQIESEDQLQEARQEGQDKDNESKEDNEIQEEEDGIEMTDDFDGKMHDADQEEEEENQSNSEDEDEEEKEDVDNKMGNLDGADDEKFDEKFWGDSDDEEEEGENENEKGPGADGKAESELVAKEENKGEQEGKEKQNKDMKTEEDKNDEINELSEDEFSEKENGDDNEDDNENERREMKNDDDEQPIDEFPADMNLDEAGNEDSETENEENANKKDVDDEEDESQHEDGLTKEEDKQEEINESEENDNKEDENEDVKDVDDPEKPGQEPQMENKDDTERAREDRSDSKENQDISQPSDTQAFSSSVQSVADNESSMEAQSTGEELQQQQQQGVGSSEQQGDDGHDGISSVIKKDKDGNDQEKNRRKDYNKSRQDRSLANDSERELKRPKTIDANETERDEKENEVSTELYQHVLENESYDAHALDAATAEQALDQSDRKQCLEDSDTEMNSDNEEHPKEPKQHDETKASSTTTDPRLHEEKPVEDENEDDMETEMNTEEPMEDDIENKTQIDSGFYTSKDALMKMQNAAKLEKANNDLRRDLEMQLASWAATCSNSTRNEALAIETWRKYENLTSSLSQELCEHLRLVLEPTLASKLRGDYRSGKRLNMRKVIPYIASQFRKDKIWLRRTKKSRRQYQIMLAVDDSSSMDDNHSKQLAFESLAVISNALTWLEAGELAVCSFGETTKLLHSFREGFNEKAGSHILNDFTFEQKKTNVALMLDTCSAFMMKEQNVYEKSRIDTSQLLLIVSDGRGIFLEGKEVVERSVRRAREAGLFMVFIILDNPSNRDSILDIKVPIFKPGGQIPEIKSYMDEFPFPFYLILRDINSLPIVLSDALRQWFELVTSMT